MDWARQMPEQAGQEWLDTLRSLAEQIQKQQQYSQQMIQELMNTYMQLLNTPASYLSADGPAVDGAGPRATAILPAAGSGAATILPADDPGGREHLLRAFQHPHLLRQEGHKGRPVPYRGLRRTHRGGGQRASELALGRGPKGGTRLRGAKQETRDHPRAAGSQDKGWLLLGSERPNGLGLRELRRTPCMR